MKITPRFLRRSHVVLNLLLFGLLIFSLARFTVQTSAQTSSCTATNTPGTLPTTSAWPQNALVSVNLSGFTQAEYDCLRSVFDNFNLDNSSSAGNSSGVRFSVTNNAPVVATVDPASNVAANAPGITYGLQINKQDLGALVAGETYTGMMRRIVLAA
ncbi:MAG TPA: hypothetical protein VF544_13785 [Pyrinomonadaceae bacterium]|jgi:hypothetical protein